MPPVLSDEEKAEAEKNNYNFDHPDAFDIELLVKTLTKLKAGKRVEIPIYNFKVNQLVSDILTCLMLVTSCQVEL